MRGALTLPSSLHLLLHPKLSSRHYRDKYLRLGTGLGGGVHLEAWGLLGLQAPALLGMEKLSGRDRAGKQGGAAGLGGHSLAKVTSEIHSRPMQGESGPSTASAWTIPSPLP